MNAVRRHGELAARVGAKMEAMTLVRTQSNHLALCAAALLCGAAAAQAPATPVAPAPRGNVDEARVGTYTLPDPLRLANGKLVTDARAWNEQRRPEILKLVQEHQFGFSPERPKDMTFEVFDKGTPAFEGKAIRRQVTIYFSGSKTGPKADLLLYLPAGTAKPVPLLLNFSFSPNSATVADPELALGEAWNKEGKKLPAPRARRNPGSLQVEATLARGFGIATIYYGDIDPDFGGATALGVRGLYLKPGQTEPAANEWGSVAAWAWGLSRAMDYLETDSGVDARRVALLGVSRLGKAVVWAGAHDARFALVIASCSGEGGAALSHRDYGETVQDINAQFPYWFCANYLQYGGHVDRLPLDSHYLLALIAPRPILLQTADQDTWSDPKGEFLAAVAAEPVYRLLGKQGLGTDQWPPAGQRILHDIGYYMHAGGHGAAPADWGLFLDFMQMHLAPK